MAGCPYSQLWQVSASRWDMPHTAKQSHCIAETAKHYTQHHVAALCSREACQTADGRQCNRQALHIDKTVPCLVLPHALPTRPLCQ
jgi:hypothetical protein